MKEKPLLQCHVLVPGFVRAMVASAPRLPTLELLLARSGQHANLAMGAEQWLCRAFGVAQQDDWPVAAFSALGDGLSPAREYWLRADPVHLRLLRDSFVVEDCAASGLEAGDANALIAALNQHFAEDGLQFFAPHPSRWYLRLNRPLKVRTHPLAEAIGRDADRLLPQGEDAMVWHGWLNEMQMLLHEHPVNLVRDQQGKAPVNSVWAWGGGILPPSAMSSYDATWAEDALALGLARSSGCAVRHLPPSFRGWMDGHPENGNHLIVLDECAMKHALQSAVAVSAIWEHLEQEWFAPLLQALKQGRLDSIHLYFSQPGQTGSFRVNRGDLWKFWRRGKSLQEMFDG